MLIFTCHGKSNSLRCIKDDISLMGNVSYLGKHLIIQYNFDYLYYLHSL